MVMENLDKESLRGGGGGHRQAPFRIDVSPPARLGYNYVRVSFSTVFIWYDSFTWNLEVLI